MKKILFIWIALVVLTVLASCAFSGETSPLVNTPHLSQSTASSLTTNPNAVHSSFVPVTDDDPIENVDEAIIIYRTFEEVCDTATDVVLAKYKGRHRSDKSFMEYQFTVYDCILGNAVGEISVYARRTRASVLDNSTNNQVIDPYYTDEVPLVEGHRYLLPIRGYLISYYEEPCYMFSAGLAIDMDDLSLSTMYGKQDIGSHMNGLAFRNASADDICTYVETITRDNASLPPVPTPKSLLELCEVSPDIFVVTVGKVINVIDDIPQDYDERACVLQEILKTDDPDRIDEISVKFFQNTVKEGDTVIVFVSGSGSFYYFVANNTYIDSVQSIDKKDEIIALLHSEN